MTHGLTGAALRWVEVAVHLDGHATADGEAVDRDGFPDP